mgnify:FL=1
MDRELRDLDDVDKALEEKPIEGVIERKRARRIANMRKRQKQEQLHEMLGLLGIPAVVVVLIIIILILDRSPKNPQDGRQPLASASELQNGTDDGETEAASIADGNAGADEDASLVRQYNDEYMTKLFQDYFNARLQGDTDTLYRLTGVTNQTEEQTASLQKKLKTQAGYIEAYQDIQQYAVDGLEKNTKLVFVTYNVKFRRTDTLAPGIMYCYVKVNDQNSFEIVENMSPEQTKFVNSYITNHSEVQELINATNSRLLEAISSDQRLAVIYDAIQSGRIYTDSQEEIDSEVSLISVETEAPVTEAETTASSEEDTATAEAKESSKKSNDQKSSEKSTTETKKSTETTTAGETISENNGAGSKPETTAAVAGETIAEPGAADNAPAGDAVISDDGPVG